MSESQGGLARVVLKDGAELGREILGTLGTKRLCWAVVAHAFNSHTQEAEAGGSLSSRLAWSTNPVSKKQRDKKIK